MSKAADKIRQVLQAPLGPNVPSGASRQFVNLVKAIGEAGSNHVRTGYATKTPSLSNNLEMNNFAIKSMSLADEVHLTRC